MSGIDAYMVLLVQLVRMPDCGSGGHRFKSDIAPKLTYEGNAWPVAKRSYHRQRIKTVVRDSGM